MADAEKVVAYGMIRISLVLLAFIVGVSIGAPAFAATVTAVQGQVLVNRGQGYQLIQGATEVNPGDTVVVNPGGIAQIVYPDGCSMQFQPGSVVAIGPQSPCEAQQQSGQAGVNGTTLAIGAVVVGGGVAAIILLSQNDKPASP